MSASDAPAPPPGSAAAGPDDDPVSVLLVDDSSVVRGMIRRSLEEVPDLEVTASAGDGRNALRIVRERPVDVVLLDVEMPEMNGLEALPRILEASPSTQVLMVSSLTRKGAEVTVKALTLGAADCVAKPSSLTGPGGVDDLMDELVPKIRAVGRGGRGGATSGGARAGPGEDRRGGRAPAPAPDGADGPGRAGEPAAPDAGAAPSADGPASEEIRLRSTPGARPAVLALAASTGGPKALQRVLGDLPDDFELPVLVVQHMPPIFTDYLARRLDKLGGREVAEVRDERPVRPGRVYVAPGDHHLVVAEDGGDPVVRVNDDPPVNYCRPSVDPLFRSAAAVWGERTLGVVLTGMGQDGRDGAREIVRRGGTVLVQDEATSLVWGMPGAVARAGLAHRMLPLDRIADGILRVGEEALP